MVAVVVAVVVGMIRSLLSLLFGPRCELCWRRGRHDMLTSWFHGPYIVEHFCQHHYEEMRRGE